MMSSSGSDDNDLAERIRLNANLPRGMGMGADGNVSIAMRTELDLVKQSMDRDRNLEEFGGGESIIDQSQFRNTQIGEGYQYSSVVRQRGLKGLEKEHKLSGPVIDMTSAAGNSSTHHDLVKAKAISSSSKKKSKEKKHKHKHKKQSKHKKRKNGSASDSDDSAGRKHRHKKKHKRDLERNEKMKFSPTTSPVITTHYLEMARPALQRLRDKLELVQERRL